MDATANTFFLQCVLSIQYPAPFFPIILLDCHLIMWNKHQTSLDVIGRFLYQFNFNIPHRVFHQSFSMLLHGWKKYILSVFNNIWSLVSVIIKGFLVLSETETFFVQ